MKETEVATAYSISQLQDAFLKATPQKFHAKVKEYFKQPGIFVNSLKSQSLGIGYSTIQEKYIPFIPVQTGPVVYEHIVRICGTETPHTLNEQVAATLSKADIAVDWSYVVVDTEEDYKEMLKNLAERNGRLRAQRAAIEKEHLLKQAKADVEDHIFIALDIEAWEQDQDNLIEVGWTMWDPRKPASSAIVAKHFIIKENLKYRNSIWVPDHRLDYLHGESRTCSLDDTLAHLMVDMKNRRIALVGHDLKSDLEYLKTWSYDLEKYCDTMHDTRDLYLVVSGNDKASLQTMCTDLGISTRFMHNAGNDAYATMMTFLKMVKN
ncbi:hypothetical protein HDU87_001058 [Geranomyces variabilis]|uniref:Gfd2/YDR514C-like C-terminal domain-containing protein n=1 Tax=Geranomyces variabilis TaxID=109894 RepID=A0AAD5TSU0_9FUNG|nr:hypothetical protein HDU87_001058 [Geranomyces variabilis]